MPQNGLAAAAPADRIASLPNSGPAMSDPVVQPASFNAPPAAAPVAGGELGDAAADFPEPDDDPDIDRARALVDASRG